MSAVTELERELARLMAVPACQDCIESRLSEECREHLREVERVRGQLVRATADEDFPHRQPTSPTTSTTAGA